MSNFGIRLRYSEYNNNLLKVVLRSQIILQKDKCHDKEAGKTLVFICIILKIRTDFRKFKLSI